MHVIRQNRSGIGAMGVVAGAAPGLLNRVVHVFFLEGGAIGLVAVEAQGRVLFGQQPGILCRGVRGVAAEAVLLHRAVSKLIGGDFFSQLLVALEAEGAAAPEEVRRILGRMGIVAGDALPFADHLMHAFRAGRHHTVVAVVADRIGIPGQQHAVVRGMGVMAARALPFRQWGMNMLGIQLAAERRMTAQAEFAAGPRLELERAFRAGNGCNEAKAQPGQKYDGEDLPKSHSSPLLLSNNVTLIARSGDERSMHSRFEIFRIFRSVRVVTFHAVHHFGGNPQMRFLERVGPGIVTLGAQGLKRQGQQLLQAGGVGLVTALAIPFRRGMFLFCGHLGFQFVMAGQTEVGTVGQKQRFELGLVRVVTAAALTGTSRFMLHRGGIHPLREVAVAGRAELVLRRGRHPFVIAGMGIVTGHALAFRIRVVNRRRFLLEQALVMTGRTEFFPLGFEQLGIIRAVAQVTGRTLSALHRFMDVGTKKLPLQPGMAGIADGVGTPRQHVLRARPVGVVTTGTLIFREGAVLILVFIPVFARAFMALVAQIPLAAVQQPCEGR